VIVRSTRKSSTPRKRAAVQTGEKLSANRSALVKRMWCAAEAQVSEIENRLLDDSSAPLERERDARVLAVLAKTLRELSALEQAKPRKQSAAHTDDESVPRDIDALRRSLAQKLEALVARSPAGVSDET
jgi:hypothetical protein